MRLPVSFERELGGVNYKQNSIIPTIQTQFYFAKTKTILIIEKERRLTLLVLNALAIDVSPPNGRLFGVLNEKENLHWC